MKIPENIRLGYCCINMNLRKQKKKDGGPVFMSRTVRLATLEKKGLDFVKALALQNLRDLMTILEWNNKNGIYVMRLSSDIFPFASHFEHGYSLDFADLLLRKIGDYAKEHKMRLTFHPSHFNVLSSPNETVIRNTMLDLNHHADILSRMGLDKDSVLNIHAGGCYNNKQKALLKFEENFLKLPIDTRNRIVIENCESSYNVEELLPISEKLQIPITVDFHHDDIYPSTEPIEYYFDRVYKVWHNRGIKPKCHVSNSCPGVTKEDSKTARRKHSDYIAFLHDALLKITFPIDVMLECKMKDVALLEFRNENLEDLKFGDMVI